MTIEFQPFTAAHIAAIQAAGNIGNPMEGFAKGQEQYARQQKLQEEQNRLLAQREAAALYARGDKAGAMNRLMAAGDPGDVMRYELGQQQIASQAEQNRIAHEQQLIENRQREDQINISRSALAPDIQRLYEASGGPEGTGMSLPDFALSQSGKGMPSGLRAALGGQLPGPRAAGPASSGYPQGGPGGSVLAETYKPPAGPPAPPGGQQPPAPQAPSPQPVQGGNADIPTSMPTFPGAEAPPPVSSTGPMPANPMAGAVPPQPQPPSNPFGIPQDQFAQAQSLYAAGDEVGAMEVLRRPPRPAGESREATVGGKLRDDFVKENDRFSKVRAAFEGIKNSALDDTGAGDISLIYQFMKLLDPGSTVMVGEYANAQNTVGVPDQIRNMYNKALSGQFLQPKQRRDFKQQALRLYKASLNQYQASHKQFDRMADAYQVPREMVTFDMTYGVTPDLPAEATGSGFRPPRTTEVTPGKGYNPNSGSAPGKSLWDQFVGSLWR